ncbi:MAG: DHH family phosphoesterase [Bacteroidales bacterium]|nr:DHH family phosphoesterase [Bacteroidales bacterium]
MNIIGVDKISRLESLVAGASDIVISIHTHPDGDALGSSVALLHYLNDGLGKNARIIVPDSVPSNLRFFIPEDSIIDATEDLPLAKVAAASADLIFCLDYNTLSRSACVEPLIRASASPKILVDHHLNPSSDDFDLVFSETEISSASELLFYILTAIPSVGSPSLLPRESLYALMVGMTTDTNNFANSVYPSTLAMASSLLSAGVDRDEVLSNIYNRYGENRFRAMGAVLSDLMKITEDGVAYFVMDRNFLEKYEICEGDTEGFVNLPLGIEHVHFSIFLKEDRDFFRVSIRSKKGWSANGLARAYFNGGGHECASGGRLYVPSDVADADDAATYIERVTARFVREDSATR